MVINITKYCLTLYTFCQETDYTDLPHDVTSPTEKSTNRSKVRKSKISVKCETDENTPISKLMKT